MTLNRAALIALPFAILATACSPAKGKADAPAKAAPPTATAAAADMAEPAAATTQADPDGHVWGFFQADGSTSLSYTVPDSDDTGNFLICQTGSGTVQASTWADHAIPGEPNPEARTEPTKLTLTSGKVSKVYDATATGEEMYGGAQVEANVGLNDPVMVEFAKTGVIQLSAYGVASTMPAVKLADVQKFIKACKKS